MIEIVPIEVDAGRLRAALNGNEPVLLTSSTATRYWLNLLRTGSDIHHPSGYYTVGDSSGRLLREAFPDIPLLGNADSGKELLDNVDFTDVRRLLYPCSAERRDELTEGLRGKGTEVVELHLYRPVCPADADAGLSAALEGAGEPVVIVFFSPSAVTNLFSLDNLKLPPDTHFAAIGPTTAEALHDRGIEDVLIPERPDAGLLAAAVRAALP